MDDVTKQTNKPKKDEVNIEELLQENKLNSKAIDGSVFDDTLNEIDQILNTLGEKSEKEQELVKEKNILINNNNLIKGIEELETDTSNPNKTTRILSELKEVSDDQINEHTIDKNLLAIDELNDLNENVKIKKKGSFGFYSYLILIIVIFFALYGFLDLLQNVIISKYPIAEPYIQYFFESVEITKVSILSIIDFIKNKI